MSTCWHLYRLLWHPLPPDRYDLCLLLQVGGYIMQILNTCHVRNRDGTADGPGCHCCRCSSILPLSKCSPTSALPAATLAPASKPTPASPDDIQAPQVPRGSPSVLRTYPAASPPPLLVLPPPSTAGAQERRSELTSFELTYLPLPATLLPALTAYY